MKKGWIRAELLILFLVLFSGYMLAYSNKSSSSDDGSQATRMITDHSGRQVEIPAQVDRVVTGRIHNFPAVYYLATGSCKELVGIHPASKSAAQYSMLSLLAPDILNARASYIRGDVANVEEIIKLKPDVVYELGENNQEVIDKLRKLGIPVVAVNTMSLYKGDALKTMNSWLELLGQIHGKSGRAEEIIACGNETQQMIENRLKDVPGEEKPRALMIYRHSAREIEVSGSEDFGHYWLTTTGARDVAEEVKGMSLVNMDQIYQWNPEIIYITNFCPTQPDDLLQNRIEGQYWSKIQAVQDGKVYKIPLGAYRWFLPGGDAPLMLKWLAQKHHPQIFSDYRMEDEIKDYYLRFYDYQLSDQQAYRILHPLRETSNGFE